MLQLIQDISHRVMSYIKDDPVRPDLSMEFRVSPGRMVIAMGESEKPDAITCVSFHNEVPRDVEELSSTAVDPQEAKCIIFYTIWSYSPGAGATLLNTAVLEIKERIPSVERFVTLSPMTPTARRFHLKNGATVFRENISSTNYEYLR